MWGILESGADVAARIIDIWNVLREAWRDIFDIQKSGVEEDWV